MDDMISRQTAIDALKKISFRHYDNGIKMQLINAERAEEAMNNVPSAQPEQKVGKWKLFIQNEKIKYCSICGFGKHVKDRRSYFYCPSCGVKMEEQVGDLISRQAAIDIVKGIDRNFVKYIEQLPSAQPEITEDDVLKWCHERNLALITETRKRWYETVQPEQRGNDEVSDLKPCPFCGGEAIMQQHRIDKRYTETWIYCKDCFEQTRPYFSVKEAIEEWNRRADDE